MLTIIGGDWRGRKLRVPEADGIRPSSSKVRGSIFNIIESLRLKQGGDQRLAGACLDLFSGSGALGFEALSRGAERAVFVERSRQNSKIIAANAAALGCADRVDIFCMPVEKALEKTLLTEKFQLILADPPYKVEELQIFIGQISQLQLLDFGGVFVLEHGPKTRAEATLGLVLHSQRLLGPAAISVFTRDA